MSINSACNKGACGWLRNTCIAIAEFTGCRSKRHLVIDTRNATELHFQIANKVNELKEAIDKAEQTIVRNNREINESIKEAGLAYRGCCDLTDLLRCCGRRVPRSITVRSDGSPEALKIAQKVKKLTDELNDQKKVIEDSDKAIVDLVKVIDLPESSSERQEVLKKHLNIQPKQNTSNSSSYQFSGSVPHQRSRRPFQTPFSHPSSGPTFSTPPQGASNDLSIPELSSEIESLFWSVYDHDLAYSQKTVENGRAILKLLFSNLYPHINQSHQLLVVQNFSARARQTLGLR